MRRYVIAGLAALALALLGFEGIRLLVVTLIIMMVAAA